MHGDGWLPGESADETYEFFPYAWGWLDIFNSGG